MSNLTAIPYIQERSEATPGLWNNVYSILSANIAAVDSNLTFSSLATYSFASGVSIGRDLFVQGAITVGTPPSVATRTAINIGVRSDTSDYLQFTDSSAIRSSYIIGSHVGGTADGLNIWDASSSTMIVSFSKQSIRYYAPVIGPAFDIGGSIYNVKAFGAVGNGVADDTAALQATLDAASLVTGQVQIPAGVYSVTTTGLYALSVISTLAIVGQPGTWIKLKSGVPTFTAIMRVQAKSYKSLPDVSITGVGFDGNNLNTMYGIQAIYTKDLRIDGCRFKNFNGPNLANPSYCIYSSGSTAGTPPSPYAWTANTPTGWTTGTVVQNCSFSSCSMSDSVFLYYTDGAAVVQNVMDGVGRGVYSLGWNRRIVIYNNQILEATDNGIRMGADESILGTDARDTRDIAIVGNVVKHAAKDGIRFSANHSVCVGNTSSFNTLSGLQSVVCLNSVIADNILTGNANHGIQLNQSTVTTWDTHTGVVIQGNVATYNAGRGIIVEGGGPSATTAASGIIVANNVASFNSADGIAMWDCDETCQVSGNVCVSNGTGGTRQSGIVVTNSLMGKGTGGLMISWNKCFDSRATPNAWQLFGIQVSNTTAGSSTTGCFIYYNDVSGTTSNITFNGQGIITNGAAGSQTANQLLGNSYRRVVIPIALASGDTELARFDTGQFSAWSGTALLPTYAFSSESSLGWYRSGASVIALSYGSLAVDALTPNSTATISTVSALKIDGFARTDGIGIRGVAAGNYEIRHFGTGGFEIASDNGGLTLSAGTSSDQVNIRTGSTPTGRITVRSGGTTEFNQSIFVANDSKPGPGYAFQSEGSLGWYRSAASTMAASYGTVDLTNGGAVTSVASLTIKSGANNSCGTAVLGSNGSVNVANTYVKTGDLIFLTDQTPGGTLGDLEILGIRNSSGFTIASTSVTDTSTVAWLIVRPS